MKQCEKCQKTFDCTGDSNCWCFSYSLTETSLKDIRSLYEDCLCPGCLKSAAALPEVQKA